MHCAVLVLYNSKLGKMTQWQNKKAERKEIGRDELSGRRTRGDRIHPNSSCVITPLYFRAFPVMEN